MTADNNITAFVTVAGIDLVLRENGVVHRARAEYETMTTELDGDKAVVELTDSDDRLLVTIGPHEYELKVQPKGHFFSWLKPIERAQPCSIEMARQLMRNARKSVKPEPAPF